MRWDARLYARVYQQSHRAAYRRTRSRSQLMTVPNAQVRLQNFQPSYAANRRSLWRPIRRSLLDWPLAVCSLRSVGSDDLVKMDEVHRTTVLESHTVQYNETQKWCYMSDLRTGEILIFKSADSQVQEAGK
jgi:hypothetical protein